MTRTCACKSRCLGLGNICPVQVLTESESKAAVYTSYILFYSRSITQVWGRIRSMQVVSNQFGLFLSFEPFESVLDGSDEKNGPNWYGRHLIGSDSLKGSGSLCPSQLILRN